MKSFAEITQSSVVKSVMYSKDELVYSVQMQQSKVYSSPPFHTKGQCCLKSSDIQCPYMYES